MLRIFPGRSVFVFAVIAAGCGDAVGFDWQEKYWTGMRALKESRYAEARVPLQSAYDRAKELPATDLSRSLTAFGPGSFPFSQADVASAERLQNEARTILEGQGSASSLLGFVWNGLGEIYMEQTRLDEAEQIIGKALSMFSNNPKLSGCAFLSRR